MGRRGCFAIGLFPLLLSIVALWFLHRDGGLVSSTQTEFLFKSSYMNPFIQRIIPHTISSGPLHRMGIQIDHGAPTATSPPMPASMSPIVRKTLPSVPVGAPSYHITMKHKRPGLVSPSIEFLSPHVPSGEGRVKFHSNMIPSMPPHIAKRIPSGGYQGKTSTSDAPKAAPHSTEKVSSPPRTSPLIPVSFPPSTLPLKPPSRHPIMNGMAPSMTSGAPYGINIGGHVVSPVGISPSLTNLKRHGVPVEAPPREALIPSPPLNHPPAKASSPTETPLQKHAGIPTHMAPAPLSSFPRTRKRSRIDSPAPGPSKFFRKVHGRKRVNNTAFAPSNHQGPVTAPAPIHHSKPAGVPSHAPMSFPGRHHTSGPFSPKESPSPSKGVPASLPSVPFPSSPVQGPIYPPKISPSHYPSKVPIPVPSPVALPPPPPNQDCTAVTCTEPFTNTPPGSYCSCVWPMQVGLRLSVALYTFFPLVSELALEIATGVFMKQSQVRIMGANAASQQPEKTVVLIDLVPLGQKFDNTTAFLTYEKFWHKKVVINNAFFGDYEVLYVQYPGLPPSPPSAPTTITLNDGPFVPDNKSRGLHPLGVDVRRRKDRLNGSLIAVIVSSSVIAIVIFVGAAWFLLSKREGRSQELAPIQQALALPFVKPSGAGSTLSGSAPSSASLSFGSSIATYTGSAKTFSLGEIERATNGFDPERIIGEGGFGRVYGGVLEDGVKVAVKVLKRDDQQGGREFLAEVEMLSRLHHRNLVKLIGICTEEHNRCLVYELIPNGSVESHLHGVDKESAPLDWGARMKIALGSARGLAYLHEDSSPRVIHRDFKSSNILLEDDFTPKVSDFGLARTALEEGNDYISTRVMGTFGYVAPEYAMTGHLLVKSDVYSYGVVLLELLTGRKPVDMSQPLGQENLVTWARPLLTSKEGLESIIDPALDDKFPFDSVAKVAAIASMCVQPEVSHRPFMGEVVQALKLVCDDTDEKNGESGSCSHEELSAQDSEIKITSGSSQFPETHSFVAADYNSGLEAERALSTSDILSTSARFGRQESGSFRRHSCSGPLRSGRNLQFWQTVKGMSSGSLSEHGVAPKLWAGLKRSGKWP